MAFVSTARIREGVDYSEEFDPRQGWVREFTDVYQIIISDPHDSGAVALAGAGVPQRHAQHPTDTGAFVIGRRASQESHRKYHAFIRYSSRVDENQQEENPLNQPVRRRWSSVKEPQVAVRDRNGVLILNKAHLQYDPPVEVLVPEATLTFVRNEAAFDGSVALQFVGRLNSSAFSGAATGTLICDDISAEESFFNGNSYWVVTYVFHYRPDGWQPRILEQSLLQVPNFAAGETKHQKILDEDGDPVTQPVPIGEAGFAIAPSDLPGAAISTVWDVLEEANFGSLGLPA